MGENASTESGYVRVFLFLTWSFTDASNALPTAS
jgi:hypothetical protein